MDLPTISLHKYRRCLYHDALVSARLELGARCHRKRPDKNQHQHQQPQPQPQPQLANPAGSLPPPVPVPVPQQQQQPLDRLPLPDCILETILEHDLSLTDLVALTCTSRQLARVSASLRLRWRAVERDLGDNASHILDISAHRRDKATDSAKSRSVLLHLWVGNQHSVFYDDHTEHGTRARHAIHWWYSRELSSFAIPRELKVQGRVLLNCFFTAGHKSDALRTAAVDPVEFERCIRRYGSRESLTQAVLDRFRHIPDGARQKSCLMREIKSKWGTLGVMPLHTQLWECELVRLEYERQANAIDAAMTNVKRLVFQELPDMADGFGSSGAKSVLS